METPSVSTIASLLDNGRSEGFARAAAKITAQAASSSAAPETEYRRRWAQTAELGTHVHHLVASLAAGRSVETDPETAPYLSVFEAFSERYQPSWLHLERTVTYDSPRSHSYVGTFDAIAEIDCPVCDPGSRCRWLLDWKTGRFHLPEQTLQLAAYRYAKHLTVWEPKPAKAYRCAACAVPTPHVHCERCGEVGEHRPYAEPAYYTERVDGPMPRVAHAGVVLLDPDIRVGRLEAGLVELPAGGDAHGTFLRLRDAWGWGRSLEAWARREGAVACGRNRELASASA